MIKFPVVSSHRARVLVREIAAGSSSHGRFLVLLVTASMIASIGLIANSAAVIIGAMLVSPLMTPIFGIALGMLRGNPWLLWRSISTEVIGVALAVASAYLVGLPQLTLDTATPEMIARTQPNLLDLLVAIFAGFAGAYAVVDERVSPALPGIAIAIAIVPPLATCGLCLALGAWSGAGGAMLLFLANGVSILMVALLTFWCGGLGRSRRRTLRRIVTHLGPTALAFVIIAIVLTGSFVRIVRNQTLERGIQTTLVEQLSDKHGVELIEVEHGMTTEGVQILATVRSHRTISPAWVSSIQTALAESVGSPVDLVVRTIRSRDVSALSSSLQAASPNLDRKILVDSSESDMARETLTSQVLREVFEQEPGFELTRVEYGRALSGSGIVVAYVNAIRRFTQKEIGNVEVLLRQRLEDPYLHFLVRVNAASLQGSGGIVLTEWTNTSEAGSLQVARLPGIEAALEAAVSSSLDLVPIRTYFNWTDGRWRALVEVMGPHPVTTEDVSLVQSSLPEDYREIVEVLLWRRSDFIATSTGYTTYELLTDPLIVHRRKIIEKLFRSSSAGSGSLPSTATSVQTTEPLGGKADSETRVFHAGWE